MQPIAFSALLERARIYVKQAFLSRHQKRSKQKLAGVPAFIGVPPECFMCFGDYKAMRDLYLF